jgi:hypothetical protein
VSSYSWNPSNLAETERFQGIFGFKVAGDFPGIFLEFSSLKHDFLAVS